MSSSIRCQARSHNHRAGGGRNMQLSHGPAATVSPTGTCGHSLKFVRQFEMLRSFSCCWVSGIKRMGGFGDKGFGLEGWLRVAVDGSNRFGRDWWPRKIRSVVEGCGCDRSLFWAAVLGAVRVMKIGYDGCVLRLEGCPKDVAVGGSKMVRVWWVERRKKTKIFTSKRLQFGRKRSKVYQQVFDITKAIVKNSWKIGQKNHSSKIKISSVMSLNSAAQLLS
ncbi:hypothetical protein B296_00021204 [Ensete ventricosum]|uniref:Uncharacterized protein n=1 Tax=Ensete ventricosum TaxID=4639 RepID=A0A426YFC6_ENSVE|nr:hypothetical protein B296_00021204 [Ensete ventricosum]